MHARSRLSLLRSPSLVLAAAMLALAPGTLHAVDCPDTLSSSDGSSAVLLGEYETEETLPGVDPDSWFGRIRKVSYFGYYMVSDGSLVVLYCGGAIRTE